MKHFDYNVVKIKNKEGNFVAIPALHGKTLYETAVEHGFTGTVDDWFELLIGDGWVGALQNFKAEYDAYVSQNEAKIAEIEARKINGHIFNSDITLSPADIGAAKSDLTNVSTIDFVNAANAAGFEQSSVSAVNTVFNDDGTITETSSNGDVKVTTFNSDGSITERYTLASGSVITKTIVFNSDGSITETLS